MKIFLAGTNSEQKNKEIIKKSPYILESYYYFSPWQYELLSTCKEFMLDSGAFTFSLSGKKMDWDKYLHGYVEFINKNNIKLFYELDIDNVIGYENVLKLREKLEAETGKKPIPVWHIDRGKEEFLKMCRDYEYVSIGGLVGVEQRSRRQQMLEESFPWFIKVAHDNGAKIHALGFTKVNSLSRCHFDSVDGTRWNGVRFGKLEYFDGKTIRPVLKKDGKTLKRGGENREAIMNFSIGEWIKFQKYAETNL